MEVKDIFQCTRCGYCCQGETTVSLDTDDQKRMVAALGGDCETVQSSYWRLSPAVVADGESQTVVQMKTENGHCIFYTEQNGLGGCAIHDGRPWRCGQWPLHPAILNDENNFQIIRESCPGINKKLSYREFCEIFEKLLAEGRLRH